MRIGPDIARRLILSGGILVRVALFLFIVLILSQLLVAAARAEEAVSAVRIWPAPDYTRVTIESRSPLRYSVAQVKDPERLVLDLEDVDFSNIQRQVAGKLHAEDPYIAALRVGRFKPGVVRLVFDLRAEVQPQVFTLKPVGEYGHRLVLDLYPVVPADPMLALLQKLEAEDRAAEAAETPKPSPGSEAAPPGHEPGRGQPPPGRVRRLLTIAVDAGHGGEDPGARGYRGTLEKNVTLMIARRLKSAIDAEPGMRAVLIRDGDYYVPLHQRVEKARRVKADLFVSIHADAFVRPHAQGSSVYALSENGATSAAARWLAKRENDADLIGGVNLTNMKDRHLAQTLLDLSQTATIQDSLKLGRAVLSELGTINRLHKPQVEQAGFAVLKAPDIPSILVETAFISNPGEERKLNDRHYQERMARAILRGIKRYFEANPPPARPVVAAAAPASRLD